MSAVADVRRRPSFWRSPGPARHGSADAGYRDAGTRPRGRAWRVPDAAASRSSSAARWAIRSSSVISRDAVVRRAPSRRTCPEASSSRRSASVAAWSTSACSAIAQALSPVSRPLSSCSIAAAVNAAMRCRARRGRSAAGPAGRAARVCGLDPGGGVGAVDRSARDGRARGARRARPAVGRAMGERGVAGQCGAALLQRVDLASSAARRSSIEATSDARDDLAHEGTRGLFTTAAERRMADCVARVAARVRSSTPASLWLLSSSQIRRANRGRPDGECRSRPGSAHPLLGAWVSNS
jgi:hypothetical protein